MPRKQNLQKYLFLILTFCWILTIFSFSLQDGSLSSLQSGFFSTRIHQFLLSMNIMIEKNTVSYLIRKGAHFTEFFILGSLARKSSYDLKNKTLLCLVFLVPIIDETIQSFVPDRAMSVFDMGIDSLGIIAGIGVISLIIQLLSHKLIRNN